MHDLTQGRIEVGALVILAVVLSAAGPAVAADKQLTVDYSFERPQVSQVIMGGERYDRITMPGVPNCGNAGQPALPARGARILLPFGTEVADIKVLPAAEVALGSGYVIEPVSRPVRLSAGPGAATPPTPDPAIYASARAFPGAAFAEIGTHGFRGYQILTLKLQPVQYIPASGELYYYPRLTVVVNTVDADRSLSLLRGLVEDEVEIRAKVDNPEAVGTYPAAGVRGERSYELLILTTTSLSSAFVPLKDYHDANGIPTEIRTTTDVGSSDPDDVRDYIRDRYNSDGIEYVIIGGDDDIIPAKDLYVIIAPGEEYETAMPGDIYFACLDGTYNYDGDSYWGEPTDGEGGGDVDLVAEVYVGRAAVGNTTEATRFVDKTIWYLNNQHTQTEKVLLVGEYLGFGGVADYAADTLEELVDGSSAHGYTTVGIPSSIYNIEELFERDMSWSQSDLVSRINSGVHILNHLGHGSPDYAMKLYNSDVLSDLTNDDLCFVYSQTCLAGHFDDTDCWAETMNIKTDNGGFAVIMNARYGFGAYYSTDGPSQRFNREFWDAVYGEGMPELGRANQDSKEDNLYRINEDCMRWCTYELNLFGDPTVAVKGVTGLKVTPSDDFVSEGPGGGPFTPDSKVYTLENMGPDPIDYNVTKSQSWVTITNGSGTLAGDGGTAEVTVAINATAETLPDGLYQDTVNFINTTDGTGNTARNVDLTVGVPVVVYEWTLDSDPGWTTEGQWEFGVPTGGGSYNGDPTSGYTGANVYGYNLSGDYTDNLPATYLTTETFDCTGLTDVTLKFRRWLGVESNSNYDEATIEVSNGGGWTTIWRATDTGADISDSSWQPIELGLASVADDQPNVSVRWGMGPTDVGLTYPGWNIDDIQIVAIGGEEPALYILLPDGLPEYLAPGEPTTFAVQIANGAEDYVPGSGLLHYRYDGGSFQTVPLEHNTGNLYDATLPAAGCDATPEFYISAEGDGGTTVLKPKTAPAVVYTATIGTFTMIMEDDFETDLGWTVQNSSVADGPWERGVPSGSSGARGDPPNDSDGSGRCYITGNGYDQDLDGGPTRLLSPVLDLSGGGDYTVSYARWLRSYNGTLDQMVVEISDNDGGSWTTVETVPDSSGWTEHSFNVADYVGPTALVRVRFTVSDNPNDSVTEGGIDAFTVAAFQCVDVGNGDFEPDDDVDLADFAAFQRCFGETDVSSNPTCQPGDMNGDKAIDLDDYVEFASAMDGPQ